MQPASYLRRILARAIDYLVVGETLLLLVFGSGLMLRLLDFLSDYVSIQGFASAIVLPLSLLLVWILVPIAPIWWNLRLLRRRGQTIGKFVMGIRIVSTNGDPAPFARTVWLRLIVPAIPIALALMLYSFGSQVGGDFLLYWSVYPLAIAYYIWRYGRALVAESRQGLHELLSDTRVVQ